MRHVDLPPGDGHSDNRGSRPRPPHTAGICSSQRRKRDLGSIEAPCFANVGYRQAQGNFMF